MNKFFASALVLASLAAASAHAQDSGVTVIGGVSAVTLSGFNAVANSDISGNLNQNTFVGGTVGASATGFYSFADTRIGSVDDADVKGNLTQNTNVIGAVVTAANGFATTAYNSVGVIGETECDQPLGAPLAFRFASNVARTNEIVNPIPLRLSYCLTNS